MDNKEQMQNTLKNLEERWQNINQILDKGNDCAVIQIGSRYIRYGLGSQWKPNKIGNIIAYKQSNTNHNQYQDQSVLNDQSSNINNDEKLEQQLQMLEGQLRKRGNIKQDYKNYKIKQKAKQEVFLDKYEDMDCKLKELYEKQIIFGDDCLILENHKDYIIKRPIKQQNYNLDEYESVQQSMQDLTKILEHVLYVQMAIKQIQNYSLILVVNDNFSKSYIRSLIDIFLQNINFRQVFCHLESVCASFGGCLQYSCVVNIGDQRVNVNCVEEGQIVSNTQITKNYGSNTIEFALAKLLSKRKYLTNNNIDDNQGKSNNYIYQVLKENICSAQQLEDNSNKTYKIQQLQQQQQQQQHQQQQQNNQENENKIELRNQIQQQRQYEYVEKQINYSDLFCVASNVLFDQGCLEIMNQNSNNQQKVEQQLNLLYNEFEAVIDEPVQLQSNMNVNVSNNVQQIFNNVQDPNKMVTLEELVCYSLSRVQDIELKKKMANNILLIGGGSMIKAISDELQDRIIDKIHLFDSCIEQIDCIDITSKEVNPEDVCWAGATILAKIDGVKDLWISRNKYLGEVNNENNLEMFEEDNKKSQEIGIKALREKLPFQW